jgi:predicted TIM-barrel fold metal-dependent hydrolase
MRVDAHHHLWDPAARDYPWMTGDVGPLVRRFDVDDLREAIATSSVELTVLVFDLLVCTLRAPYRRVYDAALELTATLSGVERDCVLGDNAVKTYGLL